MNDDLISRSELRARFQAILDRGDMFCEYDIVGMVDNAPAVDIEPFVRITIDKDELNRIVDERVIKPIKNGELVIKEERPHGEWIKVTRRISDSETSTHWECSICREPDRKDGKSKFCCECGAEMKKEKENDQRFNQ